MKYSSISDELQLIGRFPVDLSVPCSLDKFRRFDSRHFSFFDERITDANFAIASGPIFYQKTMAKIYFLRKDFLLADLMNIAAKNSLCGCGIRGLCLARNQGEKKFPTDLWVFGIERLENLARFDGDIVIPVTKKDEKEKFCFQLSGNFSNEILISAGHSVLLFEN